MLIMLLLTDQLDSVLIIYLFVIHFCTAVMETHLNHSQCKGLYLCTALCYVYTALFYCSFTSSAMFVF